jgi:hypothetical protein
VVAAEQRGAKVKKKLEIDPLHADTVRLIYRLALEGDGASGPVGVKNIASYLNARRIFTRDGGRWGIGQVHRILTRPTYIGRHEFNKRSKSKELKPIDEIIPVEVPALIDQVTFDAVQAHLRSRNPKVTPARIVSGPTLLTGICFCAKCSGAMTLRTGKGNRYRYYTCSTKARQGTLAAISGVKSATGGVRSSVLDWRRKQSRANPSPTLQLPGNSEKYREFCRKSVIRVSPMRSYAENSKTRQPNSLRRITVKSQRVSGIDHAWSSVQPFSGRER